MNARGSSVTPMDSTRHCERGCIRLRAFALLAAGAWVGIAAAQDVVRIDPLVITATRIEERAFDLPVAIDSIGAARIQQGQLQINLSESLSRVPGLVVQNRWNYAQDLQVSSRGFGARASFGVRGIRLYQDGIPATMPDGQGQTGSFSLASAQRIEVLRGPVLDPLRQCRGRRDLDLQRGRAADADGAGAARRRQLWHLECDREIRR